MTGEIQARNESLAAMYGGKPFKTYKKMILGRLFVTIWDNYEDRPVGIILTGDPKENDPDSYIRLWSEKDDYYFRNIPHNREHLKTGRVIEVKSEAPKPVEKTLENSSDEDLVKLVNSPFLALQNALNKTESIAFLFRVLNTAQELEKSDKIIKAIESRLSEVQEVEFTGKNIVIKE